MATGQQHKYRMYWAVPLLSLVLGSTGCEMMHAHHAQVLTPCNVPRELQKAYLPPYTVEPPDILTIDAVTLIPKAPYRLRPLDVLGVQVLGTLPESPIAGNFQLDPGGQVNFGAPYGILKLDGLTMAEAEQTITNFLRSQLREPQVSLSLIAQSALQQIAGQHLVAPDGTVNLGSYGNVLVVGLTVAQAKQAVEMHLSQFLENPQVSVDVFAYNSQVYYVVVQGAGSGDGVFRFPVTGNETVLDAISQINGLGQVSSTRIWIARPAPKGAGCEQVLPVDWKAITQCGNVETNYQIMPRDRVFVAQDQLIALDTQLAKLISPLERVLGFTLLGTGAATRLSGRVLQGGGNPNGSF